MVLVTLAGVTAVLAAVLGKWLVTVVLLTGVALHALGWVYLYRQGRRGRPAD